jgi:hypothetical protein
VTVISRSFRNGFASTVLAATALFVPPSLFAATPAAAATALRCTAVTVATGHSGFTTETVRVQTTPDARVTATAHYQHLTRVSKSGANSSGATILSFHDSNVRGHFHVVVDVTVTLGTARGSCVTGFTDD